MQTDASISHQFSDALKMAIDHPTLVKTFDDQWADVCVATNCGRVAKSFGCLFDRLYQFSFRLALFGAVIILDACQGAGANQSPCPGTKVLGSEAVAEDFLNILIDMSPLYIHQGAVTISVLKDVAAGVLEQFSYYASHNSIAKLSMLYDAGLAGKIESHQVAFDFNVSRTQRGNAIAPILTRVGFAARPDKTLRQNSQDAGHNSLSRQFR